MASSEGGERPADSEEAPRAKGGGMRPDRRPPVSRKEAATRFDDWSPASLSQSQGFPHLAATAATFFLVSFWPHFPGMYANVYSDPMDTLWQRIIHSTGILPYVSYK